MAKRITYQVEAHIGTGVARDVLKQEFDEPGTAQRCFDRVCSAMHPASIYEVRLWQFGNGGDKLLRKKELA